MNQTINQKQRDFLIGLYAAALVMLSEGILEVASAHGATFWASSGQRHLALGFVLSLIPAWYLLRSRKKGSKDNESQKPS